MTSSNGAAVPTPTANDPRRKFKLMVDSVVASPSLSSQGGMLGMLLASGMPMLQTFLDRADPSVIGQYSKLLSDAFKAVSDPAVSEAEFEAALNQWRSSGQQ